MASVPDPRHPDSSTSEQIRLADYTSVLVENWRIFAAVAATVLFLGTFYAVFWHRTFRADALIQIENNEAAANPGDDRLASIFATKATTDAEMEVIGSRLVVGEAVQKLHLDITAVPRYFPLIGERVARRANDDNPVASIFGLSQYSWGGQRINVSRFDIPESQYDEPFVLTALGKGNFKLEDADGKLVASGKTGEQVTGNTARGPLQIVVDTLVALPGNEFTLTRSPLLDTVNALQDRLLITEKAKQSGVVSISLDGSDRRKITDTVNAVAREYVQQNNDRKSADAGRSLAFLDQQLPILRRELDQAEQRYNTFRHNNGTVDLGEESRLLLQQMVEVDTKISDLQQQRADLTQRFTSGHPAVESVNAQVAGLQRLQAELSQRVSGLPDVEQTALRLVRDVRVDTDLYTNLLNRAQELRVAKAAQAGNVRVIDYAMLPNHPVKPKPSIVLLLSAVLGVLLGTIAAFARRAMIGGVEHTDEIARATGVPISAVVLRSQMQSRIYHHLRRGTLGQHVLALQAPKDVAVEGMRNLRTTLQFTRPASANRIIALTGPRAEVGKSFLSINLATVMATGGMRVVVLDADMRRGDLHNYFNAPRGPGLSEVLAGTDVDGALIRGAAPGVDLLPSGAVPPNPAELLASERFPALLARLSQDYDCIIVDTPPVLAVTDSTLVCKHADTSLLVVRYGRHPISEIVESVNRLRNSGVSPHGILFTDVPLGRAGYASYYGTT